MSRDAEKQHYNVVIIGGGPAGMMAAGRAAECGATVLLLEKNERLGKKLLITGGGRCNVTHKELDVRTFVQKYGDKGKFLFSPFSQFGVTETIDFFESRGMPIKEEAEHRAFPVSNKAESVFDVLHNYITDGKVTVLYNSPVMGFILEQGKIIGVKTERGSYKADSYILTTGGKSRPETGSTGDALPWLADIGHTVIEPNPELVPVTISDEWVKELQGLPLKDAKLTAFLDNERQFSKQGKMLFTHFGLSGPLVLNMSKDLSELYKYGDTTLSLDLFPELNHKELDLHIQEAWKTEQNKKFKNSLSKLVQPKCAPTLVRLSGIDGELFVNKVSREMRLSLGKLMKDLKMTVSGFLGNEKAIVTSGGVSLEEVDFKTMRSLKHPNLFFAGDILDFDRPSGGFSLQICWTTGRIAGQNAAPLKDR